MKLWCPDQDSNPESPRSKRGAVAYFAIGASGGAGRIRTYTAEPTSGLQPGALPVGRPLRGGLTEIRTQNFALLRRARLPITPSARNYSPSRYRNRKVVWVAGFEPATTRFQGADSDQAELHPEKVGRGSVGTCMARIVAEMAEGEGVEPLALLRCQRRFSRPFAHRRAPPSGVLAEGTGIEPVQPLRTGYGLASRRIAALPTFRTRRMIGEIDCGAAGVESNPQPPAYKAGALPIELQRREAFGFVFYSWRTDYIPLRAAIDRAKS